MCAEPVRNVRSNRGGGRLGGWPLVLRWIFAGAVALVVGVAGCCGLGSWRMGSALEDAQEAVEKARAEFEAQRKARAVAVAAADLLQEFQDDPAAADKKYKGKCLEVSGVVERTGKSGDIIPFAILHAGDEQAQIKIECFFDFEFANPKEEASQRLKKGQAVTVRGDYGGRVSHLQLRSCVLVP
jgi:hypothetical protein